MTDSDLPFDTRPFANRHALLLATHRTETVIRDWGKPAELQGTFVETNSAEELRARRVWRFMIVLWLTWVFFAIFLWFREYSDAARVCVAASLTILMINLFQRKDHNFRRIMSLNLAVSAGGLFAVSVSDPAMHGTMLFYPVSILVASQLLGVRAALTWFIINLFAFTGFSLFVHGLDQLVSTSVFDELVLLLGVAACTYFCCQQGEEYYQQRTVALIELSEDLRRKSESLEILATTDALTGLVNRFQFQERLKAVVDDAIRTSKPMALFLIDMDGFKEINDTLGHPTGDEALIVIATRLIDEFAGRSEVARLGGDEFCIISADLETTDEAEQIAERVGHTLAQRYRLGDTEFALGASVGYCICPEQATTSEDVLAFADTAMFHAKEHRLGFARYDRGMTDRLIEYRNIQEKLSVALERDEFFLVYQPKADLHTGVVTGAEALLRWRSENEIIPPLRFIHLLERSREILPVSNWVIRQVCRQLAQWNAQGYSMTISVNVSPLQFNDPGFIDCIVDSLNDYSVDPRQLDFEITEGLLIDDIPLAVEKLDSIKQLGASISIDDFGTGFSSLSYLRQFPVDRLKIDRAFVKDIPDLDDGVIASSIVGLAKSLGLAVLAEGVETEEQIRFLRWQDCDEYQGYYLSEPVPPEEVVAFFEPTEIRSAIQLVEE